MAEFNRSQKAELTAMSAEQSGAASPATGGGDGAAAAGETSHVHHPRSFKLRFAAQREPGRSYVSLVKPLGLPATVTGKFYARPQPGDGDEEGTERALRRIRDMFTRTPRGEHAAPVTSAHEYGWWGAGGAGGEARNDPRLSHHVRDSAWMKARLQVLAADARLRPK